MGRARAGPLVRQEPKPEPDQMRQPSDQALLERYAARSDEEAFALLVQRHGRTVWGVCRRLLHQEQDAEDAFQAVFVVLARKAASIRNGEAVGSWLYGVAYRTAMRARHSAGCRQAHERQAGEQARRADPARQAEPSGEAACREVQRFLDEEVQRLSEKYRAPFVLCCLEGLSKVEAAQELGWKEGTVSGRLARARKLLQNRLARRGVALSASMTAMALAESASAAPAGLLQIVATGAPLAGKSAASPISPAALQLAEAVLRSFARRSIWVGLLLFLGLLVLLGGATLAGLVLTSDTLDPDLFAGPPVGLGTPIDEQVLAVAFGQDGQRLLTAGGSSLRPGQVQLWDVATKKNLFTLRPLPGVRCLRFAPDGQTFASADFKGDIRIRDAATGDERAVVHAHDGGAACVAFSADGLSLLSVGADGTVKQWQADGLAEQRTFLGHRDAVLTGVFFHHAAALVSGGEDNTAIVWDTTTGKARLTLRGHRLGIEGIAVSHDDKLIASASRDGTVRLWSAATGEEEAVLDHDHVAVHAVAFSRDGKELGTAAADGKIRLWDVKTHKLLGAVGQHKAAARAVAFSPDGTLLASGSSDHTAKLWPIGKGKKPVTLQTESELVQPILALAYAPDGNVIAMATTGPEVQIRTAASGDVLRVLKGHTAAVNCLAFSARGQMLASGSSDGTVRLWDIDSAREILALKQCGEVFALAFARDGKSLVCAGSDGVLHLWDTVSGKEARVFPAHEAPVHAVAAAPDGKTFVMGTADGTIKIWDLSDVKEPVTLKAHTGAVRALTFSAQGVLASAGDDYLVKLWEPALDRERVTLAGHEDAVTALAFTPSGRTLVSGSRDHSLRVWDGASGEILTTLRGHQNAVTTLAIHPRGKDLVSGGLDTMALRWRGTTKSAAALLKVQAPWQKVEPKAAEVGLNALISDIRIRAEPLLDRTVMPKTSAAEQRGGHSILFLLTSSLAALLLLGTWISAPSRPVRARRWVWAAAIALAALAAMSPLVLWLGGIVGGAAEERGEIHYDFRGRARPSSLEVVGDMDESFLKTEAEGLRVTLPRDRRQSDPWRLAMPLNIAGDFEITAALEILGVEEPAPEARSYGLGVLMSLDESVRIGRLARDNSIQVVTWDRWATVNDQRRFLSGAAPCDAKTLRLRLNRQATTVHFLWAPGTAGENFQQIHECEYGNQEIHELRLELSARLGRQPAALDFRLLDLWIRTP